MSSPFLKRVIASPIVNAGDFCTHLARFRELIERGDLESIEPDVFADVRDR